MKNRRTNHRVYWNFGEPGKHAIFQAGGSPVYTNVLAHGLLPSFRALDSLRDAVNDGEAFTVESTVDIRAIPNSAVDASSSARLAFPAPVLTNLELS